MGFFDDDPDRSLERSGFDQQERERLVRRRRILLTPLRLLVQLLVLSLPAGGPQRFYADLPGQVFAVTLIVMMFVERSLQAPNVAGRQADRLSFGLGTLATVATFVVAVCDFYYLPADWKLWPWRPAWAYAAAALFAAGLGMRVVAIVTLGRYFTSKVRVQEGQRVIQHGIYAVLRHPSYTGLLLILAAMVTAFASLYGYVAFLLLVVPSLINRIAIEEKVLRKALGADYLEYSNRVKRLVPFVY